MLNSTEIRELKKNLRQEIKKKFSAMDEQVKIAASQGIFKNFISNIPYSKFEIISGYHPVGMEADVIPLMKKLHAEDGKKICLPVMQEEKKPMIFREYSPGDVLCLDKTYRRVLEPLANCKILEPEIMILPLVAFDRNGGRLGYGRGYYDITLANLRQENKKIIAVGVGYSFQLFDKIPTENFDQKLDYAITEKEFLEF